MYIPKYTSYLKPFIRFYAVIGLMMPVSLTFPKHRSVATFRQCYYMAVARSLGHEDSL